MTDDLLDRVVVSLEGTAHDRELVAVALWFLRRPHGVATVFVAPARTGHYPLPAAIEAFLAAGVSVRTFRRTSDDAVATLVERERPRLVLAARPDPAAPRGASWSAVERIARATENVVVVPRSSVPRSGAPERATTEPRSLERIVVALDGSPAPEDSLVLLAATARRQEAQLVLLQVAPTRAERRNDAPEEPRAFHPRALRGTWFRTVAASAPVDDALVHACRPTDLAALALDASAEPLVPRLLVGRARCPVLLRNAAAARS